MRQMRTFVLTVMAALLLAVPAARAEVTHAAEFLVFLAAGKGEARTGTIDIAACDPRKVRVTVVRDPRTHQVVAGGIDVPVRWQSRHGLTVQMKSAAYDPGLDVFYGGALVSGSNLPGPVRIRTLCFNARGIVSMRGIEIEREWLLGDIAFCPTDGTWDKDGLHFTGTLAVQRQPKVEVTVGPRGLALKGPLAPWLSLTGRRILYVDRFELLRGHIVASGSFTADDGRQVPFTQRPLKANADIILSLPASKPQHAPAPPQHAPVPNKAQGPTGDALDRRRDAPSTGGEALVVPALQALVAPPYPLLHAFTALVMAASPLPEEMSPTLGFVPDLLAQADPLRVATAAFEGPGLQTLNVAGPATESRVPSRMTAASTWIQRSGDVVPTGYVTLGPPAFRVYYKNAPVDTRGRVVLDSPSTKLYWQTRWASSTVYFPGGGTNHLKLADDVKWEQQEGFWAERGGDKLTIDDNGKVTQSRETTAAPKPYFFTSRYEGAWSGPGWLTNFLGQDAVHDRVQANPSEFGQWFEAGLKKPLELIDFGNAYLALTFSNTNLQLYYALLNPQHTSPQNGLLFRSGLQVPGLAIYFRDGSYPFEFTRAEKTVATVLLRYTSSSYFHTLLYAKGMMLAAVMKGLITIKSPYVNVQGHGATGGYPRKGFSGTVGFELGIIKIFKGQCRFEAFYRSDQSWGLAGSTNLDLKVWLFKLNLSKQKMLLDFGAGQYLIQVDTPVLDLIVFKVQNLSIQLQLSRKAADLLPQGRHTDDNFTFLIGFNAKILRKIPLGCALVVWSDNQWELWWGKQRIPPVPDTQKDLEYRDRFKLYGLTLDGTYRIVRSNDGESVEQFVWTDPKSFEGLPTRGGNLRVSSFHVPQPTTRTHIGNLDPSSGTLIAGTKVRANVSFEVPLGEAKVSASALATEFTVNPDGTANGNTSTVPYTAKEKNDQGEVVEVTRHAKVQVTMRDGPTGDGVMTVNVFPEGGSRVPYDFTVKGR